MRAFAPNGSEIVGTLERLSGRAEIAPGSFSARDGGGVDFEWEGGTEIFYDDQETVTVENRWRMFLAEDGGEWPENQIELRDDDDA